MDQTTLVQQVLELTEAIDHAVQLADWPTAARLSRERLPLLTSIRVEQTPAGLAMVRRIQALNERLLQRTRAWNAELRHEFNQARGQAGAAQAYLAGARL
jgi:flagellar protein FliT